MAACTVRAAGAPINWSPSSTSRTCSDTITRPSRSCEKSTCSWSCRRTARTMFSARSCSMSSFRMICDCRLEDNLAEPNLSRQRKRQEAAEACKSSWKRFALASEPAHSRPAASLQTSGSTSCAKTSVTSAAPLHQIYLPPFLNSTKYSSFSRMNLKTYAQFFCPSTAAQIFQSRT